MSIFGPALAPVMLLWQFELFLVLVLVLEVHLVQSVPVRTLSLPFGHSAGGLRNTDEDFHFEDEPPESEILHQHQPVKRFSSESQFIQWPASTPARVLGLGLILGAFVTYSLFCCVKKRSGSYGERSSVPTLKIYRLKPEKGCSEIPEPSHDAAGESQSHSLRYSPAPSPTAADQPQLLRIHESTIKTDPKCKVILKDDISPPITTTTTKTTSLNVNRDWEPGQSPKFRRLVLANPDPSKEPLKPFTYSPIPPVRPVRSKSNASNGKSGANSSAAVKRSGSGLPFANPDPLREPLKPFTYSPIPVRPNQSD